MDELLNPVAIAQDSLIRLENDCTMTKMVSREFDNKFAVKNEKIGYTFNARLPVRLRGRRGDGIKVEGIQEQMVPIVINELWGQDLQNSDQDLTMTIDRFGERYVEPASATIANMIDGDLCDLVTGFFTFVGTPGVLPSSVATYAQAGVELTNNAVPRNVSLNAMVISPDQTAAVLGFNSNLLNPQKEISQQYLTGKMGTALSFKFNEDVNIARHTVGALGTAGAPTSIPLVDGPTITNNGATILTKGWDASVAILKEHDIVSFAGCYAVNPVSYRNVGKLRSFRVTADVTSVGAAGTINISPPMNADTTSCFQTVTALPADGAQVYVWGLPYTAFSTIAGVSTAQGVAFHRDAIALAIVKQELPGGMEWSEWAANPKMGMGIRLVRGYVIGTNEKITRLDVLGGVKRVRDEMGVRVCG
jgi:hypothetical protein